MGVRGIFEEDLMGKNHGLKFLDWMQMRYRNPAFFPGKVSKEAEFKEQIKLSRYRKKYSYGST